MTRSITAKLVLAFLVLSITIVALASGITYWRTVAEFKKLVFNQVQSRYVADAALFYQVNGSWEGAREYFDLRDSLPGQFVMGFQQDPQSAGVRRWRFRHPYNHFTIFFRLPAGRCGRQSPRPGGPIRGR